MTQGGLARAAGVTNKVVGYLEEQDRTPRISTIAKLAAALQVSPGWLAYGAAEPHPSGSVTDCSQLSERLRVLRTSRGLSREGLAAAAQVRAGSVQHIEEGRGAANVDTIERLAVALDISPAWLAFGDGRQPGNPTPPACSIAKVRES